MQYPIQTINFGDNNISNNARPSSANHSVSMLEGDECIYRRLFLGHQKALALMSFISGSLEFLIICYYTYLYGLSENEPRSHYQNMVRSDYKRRRPNPSHSIAIACRVCDKIFFDNVSLVFHFESHLDNEITIPTLWQHSRTLQRPKCSTKRPNLYLRDVSPSQYPVLNSMPPLNSSFDIQQKISQSTSSLFYPGLNEQIGGGNCSNYWNPHIKQMEKPVKEIIFISDDEEDGNKNSVEMLDLTLKL